MTGPQRLTMAGQIAKTLVIGAVPPAVVTASGKFGMAVGGASGGALKFFCVIWVAVTWMLQLDPLFSQKLAILREVTSTIRTRAEEK
ncbi:hypothetical protein ABZS29_26415 [Kribbella sp. NPDC005582]|uniref:hypothetical protein n=1 Tax=Kribbella sp. NPDC005582 TaxID=3156893 RepID=UPI0033A42D55